MPVSRKQVSVVVPVWNPGPNLRRCTDSLLAQSLPADAYEIVLVDDGSTDGTAERLDDLAEQHAGLVRVIHIPASGWPGRPRNVGIDAAAGEFVHLVDNDDTLPSYALERLVSAGVEHEADVVFGRPESDFRGLVHTLYRAAEWTGPLREFPELTATLTPHKMFRRSLLQEHGIRFPEGKVPLEDQIFVMQAYLHARRITVLSDRVYYSYLRRIGSGRNAGDSPIDAVVQSRAVESVLDVVDAALGSPTTAGPAQADTRFRDVLYRRFYRINLLPRLTDETIMTGDETERDQVVAEVRRVTDTRFGPGVVDSVGAAHRTLGRLLHRGDTEGLLVAGEHFRAIGLRLSTHELGWRDDGLHLELDGGVTLRGEVLRCEPADGGWAIPAALAPGVPVADRLFDHVRDETDVELSLVARATSASFAVSSDLHLEFGDDGLLRARGHAVLDPRRALAGRPLTDGVWDLRGRMRFAGWNRACTVRVPDAADPPVPAAPALWAPSGAVVPFLTSAGGALAVDVGQWSLSLPAAAAPDSTLHTAADGTLVLTCRARVTAPEARVEILLAPVAGPGGLLILSGSLRAGDHDRAVASFSLPVLPARGVWRPWLRLPDDPAPAVELPFAVRVGDGGVRVTASEPGA